MKREQKVARWGAILLAGFIFAKIGGVLFKLICAKYLEPSDYGRVALFLVLFTWLILFATLNVTFGLNKFVSSRPGKRKLYYKSAVVWCTAISLAVSAFMLTFGPQLLGFLGVGGRAVSWALAASMPLAAFYNLAIFYFRARCKMSTSTVADGLLSGSRVALLALFVFMVPIGSVAPYAAFVLSFLVADAAIFFFMGGRVERAGGNTAKEFRMMAAYSLPIFAGEVCRFVSMDADRVFLAAFRGTAEAGIYDIAVSLCVGYLIIANSYGSALFPAIARKKSDIRKGFFSAVKPVAGLYALYTAALLLLAGPIAGLLRPEYSAITGFIWICAAGWMLTGLFTLMCFLVNAIDRQKWALIASAVFAFLNLGLNLYLVPGMGYAGAAVALAVSSAAACAVLSVEALRAVKGAKK